MGPAQEMMKDGYVVRRNADREPPGRIGRRLLEHLELELTERCNNACLHCCINRPANDASAEAQEMNTEGWRGVLQEAVSLGVLTVRFTGGEPLLRSDFAELYLCARRLGLKVQLYTNGRLITPELADLFAHYPPREQIEITVYGMTPETYDAVACAPGAFEEFRRGVDLLLERGVPFLLKGALLPQNKHEIAAFAAWAATVPWMDRPPVYAKFFDLRVRRDSEAKNRLIARLRVTPEEGLAVMNGNPSEYRREMARFCSRFIGPHGDQLFTCGIGTGGCADAYGKLQACGLLRTPEWVYDLNIGSLQDALENVFPKLNQLRASNPEYLARCARCFLHGLCEQCPARSWIENGSLDTPVEYQCQVAHAQARYLGLLNDGERAWEVEDWQARIGNLVAQESAEPG